MTEEIDPSPEYTSAFNQGYLIAGANKELGEILSKVESDNPVVTAMKAGVKQFDQEKSRARYPSWLTPASERDANDQPKEQEKDIDRDR